MPMKRVILVLLALVILAGLITSLYFTFYYINTCEDNECFYNALSNCRRTTYISNTEETILQYKIKGTSEGTCKVNVLLLQAKMGSVELGFLENQDMNCFTTLGTVTEPEKDLTNCHGILKEEIQEIIIKRMHTQIVQNLGQISQETTKVL